jgi:hypothetical protein
MDTRTRFSILRTRNGEWCQATVEIRERNGGPELSITGAAGYVLTERQARRQALEYWESYFDECPEEIIAMNKKFGRRFSSATGAAKFVLECDGEYHGLDIENEEDGKVWIGHSWGQIRDELSEWFPELDSLFRWHLNGMHAGCIHQHLKGMTYDTHPGAACGSINCTDVRLGSAWYHWGLPAKVVAKVEALRELAN